MKKNISLKIAAALLCLTVLSVYLMGGMFAKYRASDSGADQARVAGFGTLELEESKTAYQVTPGVNITKDPKVSMTASEVAVRVSVDIIFASGWTRSGNVLKSQKDLLTVTVADGWSYEKNSGNTYTFYRDLAPGETLDKVSVFQGDEIVVLATIPYYEFYSIANGELDITIRARAVQID